MKKTINKAKTKIKKNKKVKAITKIIPTKKILTNLKKRIITNKITNKKGFLRNFSDSVFENTKLSQHTARCLTYIRWQ